MGEGVCGLLVLALYKYIQFFSVVEFSTEDDTESRCLNNVCSNSQVHSVIKFLT